MRAGCGQADTAIAQEPVTTGPEVAVPGGTVSGKPGSRDIVSGPSRMLAGNR